jgi:putative SOS response-associated peptidase YedK
MCGRKYADEELNWAEYRDALNIVTPAPPDNFPPHYNIAPTLNVPVGLSRTDDRGKRIRTLERMRWGLIPHWSKDMKIGSKMTNARSETLTEKPSFAPLVKANRCVIPVSGFYEWQRKGSGKAAQKQAYKVARSDGKPMFLGGLWTLHPGFDVQSYTVVTTAATEDFASIHHRLPVIMERQDIDRWLHEDWSIARSLLGPTDCAITATRISNDVGNVRNNHSGLLKPLS